MPTFLQLRSLTRPKLVDVAQLEQPPLNKLTGEKCAALAATSADSCQPIFKNTIMFQSWSDVSGPSRPCAGQLGCKHFDILVVPTFLQLRSRTDPKLVDAAHARIGPSRSHQAVAKSQPIKAPQASRQSLVPLPHPSHSPSQTTTISSSRQATVFSVLGTCSSSLDSSSGDLLS